MSGNQGHDTVHYGWACMIRVAKIKVGKFPLIYRNKWE